MAGEDGLAFLAGDDRVELGMTLMYGLQARVEAGERPSPQVMAFAQQIAATRGQSAATRGHPATSAGDNGDDEPAMLTLPNAARHLGLSTRTVRRRVRGEQLAARRDGNRLLFARADLDTYLASLEAA